MPLNEQYQLSLLQDILKNHQLDCCGTVAEYEQLQRLIQSLISNERINQETANILTDVYNYSQQGQNSSDIDAHIRNHQDHLTNWINNLNDIHLT